jgi:GTPase SAR1 family protein
MEEWIKEIRFRCSENIRIMLLGNKTDLIEKR